MQLYSKGNNYELYQGSMLDALKVIDSESIDAVITDPPYELNFMGKGWDNSGISFQPETWKVVFDVLKPGGYLLVFGGSRTYHRIACAIEDAGFEIRDCIMWLYGSGFPKSMNIGLAIDKKLGVESKVVGQGTCGKNAMMGGLQGKNTSDGTFDIRVATNQWQGWGTCLKPAYEPIIVARKPFKGSLVDNIIKNGVGGLNIDECRVGNDKFVIKNGDYDNNPNQSCFGNIKRTPKEYEGRFPANVITDGSDEVAQGMPYTKSTTTMPNLGDKNAEVGIYSKLGAERLEHLGGFNDKGSAMRYFYCAKASKKDRDEGLDEFITKTHAEINNRKEGSADSERAYGGGTNPYLSVSSPRKNIHPTVKPMELMQYLIRLVVPKNGIILDPFMGSGSTGKAAIFENKEKNKNYHFIGIEMAEEYLPIADARIKYFSPKVEKGFKHITFDELYTSLTVEG